MQGLDAAVARHAGQGGAVLGVCGGLQMLGEALIDPHGIDGNAPGLGLLPLVTVFEADKIVRHTHTRFLAPGHRPAGGTEAMCDPSTPWHSLAGVPVSGYEIHQGQTAQHPAMAKAGDMAHVVLPDGLGWKNTAGNVLGIYLHGLFEDPAALQALFGRRLNGPVPTLETVFERMADFIEAHFEPGALDALLAPASKF
jgi:adenosylcobyric acid synthase